MAKSNYYEAPMSGPIIENSILANIPAEYIPVALSALETRKNRVFWKTDDDYTNGLQGVLASQWGLLMDASKNIVDAIDRIYRLHDNFINGTQYAELNNQVSPPIPAFPPASSTEQNAARAQLARMWQLVENAHTAAEFPAGTAIDGMPGLDYDGSWLARFNDLRGQTEEGVFGIGQKYAQIKDLLKASRINDEEDQTSLGDAINTISNGIDAGTDVIDIFQNARQFLKTLATDGGLAALQLMALAGQLKLSQRIIRSIDGGGPIPPADNVLYALRGDRNIYAATVNLVDELREIATAATTDPAIAQLLFQIAARIGPTVGGSGTNALLSSLLSAMRSLAGLEAAGTIAQGSALKLQLDILECICRAVSGPPTTSSVPPWEDVLCPDNPLLTATYTFTGDVGDGILASGLTLNGAPPNWSSDNGDALTGPLLVYGNTQISACFVVAVDPTYTGTVAAGLKPILLDGYALASRPGTPLGGVTPTDYTHYGEDVVGAEAFIGYNCSINITPGDPPLDGSQVRVYIGRPDPEA